MLKRVLAAAVSLLLVCVLIWGLLPHLAVKPVQEGLNTDPGGVDQWSNVIAYVPLDDRTDNMEDVVYMAEASGYSVVMPEGDIYCTKLDGQARNANGTQHGDREALLQWVREMDEAGCDRFLLSLDQLMSGGLVNSRAMSQGQALVFDDGSTMSEAEAFDAFVLALSADPENRVYLFDSVVRLASTVGYEGFEIEAYYASREYGMVARPELSGEALTLENIFAQYPYAADGVTRAEDALGDNTYRSVLTDEVIADYLGARVRKLTLLDHVIRALKGAEYGNFHLLIGIDDSSNTSNIQYNELHYIEKTLGENCVLMAGLDSLARIFVASMAQEQYNAHVKTSVRYFGGTEDIPSSEYDRYTLRQTVDLHMALFKAQRVSEEAAELQILILTAPEDEGKAAAYCEEFVSRLEYNQTHNIPTILIEASNNTYGETIEQMLMERVDFAHLMAFAGKYDQANVTGAAFAMGFSRYLYLAHCETKDESCDLAQVQQMANSMALTFAYILHTRYPLNLYIESLGGNFNNILPDRRSDELIQEKLNELFLPACEPICQKLAGGRLITSLAPYAEQQVAAVSVSDVYFPWNRTFELSFTIHVDPLTEVSQSAA